MTEHVVIQTWPNLKSLSSTGKVKVWGIKVVQIGDDFHWISHHGYENSKIVEEQSSVIKGKNLGKKNATTDQSQAVFDAQSKWNSKIDKNYSEAGSALNATSIVFSNRIPMLAHKWSERKHNAVFPGYVQAKLNGIRAIYDPSKPIGERFTSKSGKTFTCVKILEAKLDKLILPEGVLLDGEFYIHQVPFETISSIVKRERAESDLLQFWCFDIADTTLPFSERSAITAQIAVDNLPHVPAFRRVESWIVESEEEVYEHHARFIIDRYEGTMFRNSAGMYVFDYRTTDLLKYKDFIDAEFEIVGGRGASGSDEGTIVYTCKIESGAEFDVRPVGTRAFRRKLLEQLDSAIGKMLTVKFQNLSEDGIPIFPVGVGIRDYE